MTRYRFELVLAALLVVLCTLVWRWQTPSHPLTEAEVAQYLEDIDAKVPMPADEKGPFLKRLRAFGERDDGKPVYMLNLMRYFAHLRSDTGIPADFNGTPAEANAYYEQQVLPLALKSGSLPIFIGNVHEPNVIASSADEDNWSRIVVMHYPSRRAFFDLLLDPSYPKYVAYKAGSLHVGLVPVDGELVAPDFRFLTIGIALVVFLAAGWIRAVRRTGK